MTGVRNPNIHPTIETRLKDSYFQGLYIIDMYSGVVYGTYTAYSEIPKFV